MLFSLSFSSQFFFLNEVDTEDLSYAEREGPDKQIGEALENELKMACHIHKKYREGEITLTERNRRIGRRKRRLENHLEDGMANGSDDLFKLSKTLLPEPLIAYFQS